MLVAANAPPRTLVAYSADPNDLAADGGVGGQYSPYTKVLLDHLASPGVPVEELFKTIRRELLEKTKSQRPWYHNTLPDMVVLQDPVLVKTVIEDGDDELVVSVGSELVTLRSPELNSRIIHLPAGDTQVVVRVFNQHTFVGHNSLFGAPEGWSYRLKFERPDGTLVARIGSAEDPPEKDGPRHGKTFLAGRLTLHVDPVTRAVGALQDANPAVWRGK